MFVLRALVPWEQTFSVSNIKFNFPLRKKGKKELGASVHWKDKEDSGVTALYHWPFYPLSLSIVRWQVSKKQAAACLFVQYCRSQRQRPISACNGLEQQMQTQEIASVSWLAYWRWVGVCLCVSSLWLDKEPISSSFSLPLSLSYLCVFKAKTRERVVLSHTQGESPSLLLHSIWASSTQPVRVTKSLSSLIRKKFVWIDFDSCVGHLYILACFCNMTSVFRGAYFTFWVFLLVSSLVCSGFNI